MAQDRYDKTLNAEYKKLWTPLKKVRCYYHLCNVCLLSKEDRS